MSLKKTVSENIEKILEEQGYYVAPDRGLLEVPRNPAFGDYAFNCAALLPKNEPPPLEKATRLKEKISVVLNDLAEVNTAGSYVNIKLKPTALWAQIEKISRHYGAGKYGTSQKILLEFVSANPTGPLHIGHGRWAAIGDSLVRTLKAAGQQVSSEFFINDVGRQVEMLALSVQAAKSKTPVPEDGYHGLYIKELAEKIKTNDLEKIKSESIKIMLAEQKKVLEKFRVKFDGWFSENSLHASGEVKKTLEILRAGEHIYDKDGAVWFNSTTFGDDKDRVLVREDGRPTYFMSDIAYHQDKIDRGFHRLINIWGADHHGYVQRLSAAVDCLETGEEETELTIIIGQLVNLFRGGEPVRMSKRTGDMITLDEVIDEIGPDAARYLLVRTSASTALDFDLELAKKHSDDNPVYYVQYAHARISSIFEKQKEKNISVSVADEKKDYEFSPPEINLMMKLISWPDELELAARNLEPQRLPRFAEELATVFHAFYHNCQVLDEANRPATAVRLKLAGAAREVLAFILELLGVAAPQKM